MIDPAARRARRRTHTPETSRTPRVASQRACRRWCNWIVRPVQPRATSRRWGSSAVHPAVAPGRGSPTTVGGQQSPTPPAPQSRLGTGARPVPNHADNGRNLRQSTSPRWVSRSPSTARFRGLDPPFPHSSHARGRIGERSDGPPRTTGAPWRVRAISSRRRALRLGQCGRREGARDLQRVRGGAAAHRRALGSRRRRVRGAAVRCVGPIAQGACSPATAGRARQSPSSVVCSR